MLIKGISIFLKFIHILDQEMPYWFCWKFIFCFYFHVLINYTTSTIYINIFVWLLQSEGILDLLLKSQHLDPLVFIDMMDFCILHGYKISRDFMTRKVHSVKALQNCEQIQSWLQKTFETVPSLSNICRNLIRQQLSIRKKSRLQKSIENLPLPFLLKDFLAFKGEECESLLKLTFWELSCHFIQSISLCFTEELSYS